jgi:hypothetical protein
MRGIIVLIASAAINAATIPAIAEGYSISAHIERWICTA